jgi:zinc D-Ala-D-Ala carboxypeptidase
MAQLSEHFSEAELGVEGQIDRIRENARFLCEKILEPIRAHYSAPLVVHDGYRNILHNVNVGGKPTSWHLFQEGHAAADFHVEGVPLTQLFNWLRSVSGLPFDKVILEHGFDDIPRCVHVQVDARQAPRRLAYIGGTGASKSYQQVEVA